MSGIILPSIRLDSLNMANISFSSPEAFEDFCCDWMSHLVLKRTGTDVRYLRNGGRGHNQHGIDLVPAGPETGIVGQAKFTRSLTWRDIEDELMKTATAPGYIAHYIVLTSATPHPSVLDKLRNGPITWTDGVRKFQVEVHYVKDVDDNLSFVPTLRLARQLPHVMELANRLRDDDIADQVERDSIIASRKHFPSRIGNAVDALEQKIYSGGRVPQFVIDPLADLFHAHDRITHARLKPELRSWYQHDTNVDLAACLPAAACLLAAVGDFVMAVQANTVSEDDPDYGSSLQLTGIPRGDASRMVHEWDYYARYLVQEYRTLVNGQPAL